MNKQTKLILGQACLFLAVFIFMAYLIVEEKMPLFYQHKAQEEIDEYYQENYQEIKNIKDETKIEKQFIFYLKTKDKKLEKVLEYYLENGFKENKEFICYLYLKKSNGKKIETIKKRV